MNPDNYREAKRIVPIAIGIAYFFIKEKVRKRNPGDARYD